MRHRGRLSDLAATVLLWLLAAPLPSVAWTGGVPAHGIDTAREGVNPASPARARTLSKRAPSVGA